MAEVWAAAIGAAAAVAGTAYSISASEAAAKAANSVKPKKFVPVDIPKTQAQAVAADAAGYIKSDEDWKARFPKLAEGRDFAIRDALNDRSGAVNPLVQSTLAKSGLNVDLGEGSLRQAKNMGAPILSKQQRDRTYFQRLLAQNPQRQFGLSGQDVARIAITNTNSQSNFNQGLFGSRMNAYSSQVAQTAENNAAALTGLTSALGSVAKIYSNNRDASNDPTNVAYYKRTG